MYGVYQFTKKKYKFEFDIDTNSSRSILKEKFADNKKG